MAGDVHKPSGFEMMLMSLLRQAGFDPDKIAQNIASTVAQFQDATKALQLRLDAIDKTQQQIDARLERIEIALEISGEKSDTVSEPRRITSA